MPAHKNQHFVPRCHLKPFTLNGEGLAINLFNLSRARAVQNAPVKKQCARGYLHGTGMTEHALAVVEGEYSRFLIKLTGGEAPTERDYTDLRFFMFLQSMRTESAVMGARAAIDGLKREMPEDELDLKSADDEPQSFWMLHTLEVCVNSTDYVDDLKVVIVRNATDRNFVTSDNPAFLTNRYQIQRLGRQSFGYMHAGAMIAMPLTPRMYALCYDGAVYTIPRGTGEYWVEADRLADIHALNVVQYLSAAQNLYFRSWDERTVIAEEAKGVANERAKEKLRFYTFDREHQSVGEADGSTQPETVTGFEAFNPCPPIWPSFIKYRAKPKTFSDGSSLGAVRKREWLTSSR